MDWTITYFDAELREGIMALSKEILARYLVYADLLIEFGPELSIPDNAKLAQNLYVMRVRHEDEEVDFYYCESGEKEVSMLSISTQEDEISADEFVTLIKQRQQLVQHKHQGC